MNLYAPSDPQMRKRFFKQLAEVLIPEGTHVIAGGVFNCVIDRAMDRRTKSTTGDVGRVQLQEWVERTRLIDSVEHLKPQNVSTTSKNYFASEHHTYFYKLAHNQTGSSEIDRWYLSSDLQTWIRRVEKNKCPLLSDHYGVRIHLQSPINPVRIKRQSSVYPMPTYVTTAAKELIKTRLADFHSELGRNNHDDGAQLAEKWDQLKTNLCTKLTQLKHQCRRKVAHGYRQRIRRLMEKLRKCEQEEQPVLFQKRKELLQQLNDLQNQRRNFRRKRLTRQHTWSEWTSSKFFFRRICTRFGDNVIHQLKPAKRNPSRDPNDKANILADAWYPIMNSKDVDRNETARYVDKMRHQWRKTDLVGMDDPITEEEVEAAIKKCKRGNAAGPDRLGNDRYKDHLDGLRPILTTLFNKWMEGGGPSHAVSSRDTSSASRKKETPLTRSITDLSHF